MTILSLELSDEHWQFRKLGEELWRDAVVPGCVHSDLRRLEEIPDPFYGTNELDLQWVEEATWEYRCDFTVDAALVDQANTELVFEGLDTVASVWLNGDRVLDSDNMFHTHRLDVKGRLLAGDNDLRIVFGSAMEYIRTHRTDFHPPKECNDPVGGSSKIRKQPCQFGWDWGPRFVTCGVWKPVRIEAWSQNRLQSVQINQRHTAESVELHLTPELEIQRDGELQGEVRLGGTVVAQIENGAATVRNPQLWWPTGQGAQPLYEIEARWVENGQVVGVWTRRIGLRTIELDLSPDGFDVKSGDHSLNRFGFRVNGRLVFAKGANWIPAHTFVAGLKREDYEPLLRHALDANMNFIRVWGGGIYENKEFYDLCDELGLLVWQDFLFACSLYPSDEAFVESVRREAEQNVRRLRHHVSLALWCGNNEIVMIFPEQLKNNADFRRDYQRIFLEALPDVLSSTDPVTPYIHTSPCYAVPGIEETQPPSHDEHEWNVWHARAPVSHYETTNHRFVSEFGMQSYPSPEVAATFCPPDEMNVFSPVFENHQKNVGGNQVIFDYVSQSYRFPKDYRSVAYLSQLNQAYCMKVAIEHFRRQSPQCLGAVYWQLNDVWPVASWSSLEFGGKWKALHHYARRFFAPCLVSARHIGTESRMTGNYTTNTRGIVELHAVSDRPQAMDATLRWQLCRIDGMVLKQSKTVVRLEPAVGQLVETVDLLAEVEQAGRNRVYLRIELSDAAGAVLSEDTVLFAAPRALDLKQEAVQASWRQQTPTDWLLSVHSDVLQHRVCLELEGAGVQWSDNFFDLYPGESREIYVKFSQPVAESDLDNLLIYSIVDTYK